MRALLIKTGDQPIEVVDVDGLEAMAHLLNARYVERVRVDREIALAVDEEGRLKPGAVVNQRASLLYGSHRHGQPIVGDALLCAEGFIDGPDPGVDFIDADPEYLMVWFETALVMAVQSPN